MAKVLGKSGRYASEMAVKKFTRTMIAICIMLIALGFISGLLFTPKNIWISIILIICMGFVLVILNKKIKLFEQERLSYRKGAIGETIIGLVLDGFPDSFRVIHDLTTPFGNVDHVVIGPTGVFLIDTKNWRGIVSSDGNGELLVNNKPTNKPEIKNFTARIMNIKDKIRVLSGHEPYIQGIFAFPSAFLEAKWGTTGYIYCVRDDVLYDCIAEGKCSKKNKLSEKEIDSIAQAFLALAIMDKGFEK